MQTASRQHVQQQDQHRVLNKQMEKAQNNIEKLKDADRDIVYKNGNGDAH